MIRCRDQVFAGLALWSALAISVWVYWPGLSGPFLLDDGVNLRPLESLSNSFEYFADVVSGNISGPTGRPISMFGLAASYMAAGPDPWAFKKHNLCLHLLIGCILYWFLLLVARAKHIGRSELFAAAGCALWLFSPLMVSTVLYPVQRMTQMSTLLTLIALVLYAKGRLLYGFTNVASAILIVLALLVATLAVFAKENGAIALPLLFLTEFALFRPVLPSKPYLAVERSVIGGIAAILALAVIGVVSGNLDSLFLSYKDRDFTMSERLLTQCRVLWDYIFKFFWPLGDGYSLFNDDFEISRGIFRPLATFPAVVATLGIMASALLSLFRRKNELICYGVLFFFAAHAIESTILPLEIYFEHRNYLPTVGLAVAACAAVWAVATRCGGVMWTPVIGLIALLLLAASRTGILSSYWGSAELLAIRDVSEHPNSARANMRLATQLAKAGFPEQASAYSRIATEFGSTSEADEPLREFALYCMASHPAPNGLLAQLDISIRSSAGWDADEALDAIVENTLNKRCDRQSVIELSDVIYAYFNREGHLTRKALGLMVKIENNNERYSHALNYAETLVASEPNSVTGQLMIAYLAQLLDEPGRSVVALNAIHPAFCNGDLAAEQADSYQLLIGSLTDKYAADGLGLKKMCRGHP